MKKIFCFKYTLQILVHSYIALTILSFIILPDEFSSLLGSYSLLSSFIGFLAFENLFMQIISLVYFFAFLIVLIIVYLKAIVKRKYKGFFTMTVIDCIVGIVIQGYRIGVDASDGLHLFSVLIRILFSIMFYYTLKKQNAEN